MYHGQPGHLADPMNPMAAWGMPVPNVNAPAPSSVVPNFTGVQPGMPGQPGMTGGVNPAMANQGWWGKMGGLEGLSSIAQGLASLGQVYGAIQGVKLAKDQLNFSKQAYNTNLQNQTQSYNTALEDRIRARYNTEGRAGDVDSYLAKHSL